MSDMSTIAHQPIYLKNYRAPHYLIDDINLSVDLFDDFAMVRSSLRVRANKHHETDLILNGEGLELISIHLEGRELTSNEYEVTDQLLIVRHVPANFQLDIVTKIYPKKNTALSGLYYANTSGTYCTQCEAEGFRHITYYLDHPDVLAKFTTTITADKKYPHLLSNGNLTASGELPNNRHFATWEDPFKKPCYLFALVAGDFDLIESQFTTQSNHEVALRIYVEKGLADQATHAMDSLKRAMRWDEGTFGREYDLDIYMIVAIGDFNMGAMENKGLNIFNTKYVLAKPETATDDDYINILSVIGHEYFHNWSGNRVTCRDWFQLSLKEGLTIFRDQSFTEDELSHAVMRIHDVRALRETQFPEDAGPLAHPVRPDAYIEINNFYTATVYNKGAEVLRMLQTILGKTTFRKGMDLYFSRHDGHAVTIEDFVKIMEDVSGLNLAQFRLWYTQAGTPRVEVTDHYDDITETYTLHFTQTCPPTPHQAHKKPMTIPIKMGLLDQSGQAMPLVLHQKMQGLEHTLLLTEEKQEVVFQHVTTKPTPSLLRHFSAPIILHYPYTDEALRFLFQHDLDAFNRWECGQQYSMRQLLQLTQSIEKGNALQMNEGWLAIYADLLMREAKEATVDLFFLSEMLALPSEKYIGEQMQTIAVDNIHAARVFARLEIAKKFADVFYQHYQANHTHTEKYKFDMKLIGQRQFKNSCLAYLMLLPNYAELGMTQFKAALKHNMTDTQVALAGLNQLDSPLREEALRAFYETYRHDALVVDKWLAIQASCYLPNALSQIKALYKHPAFDIKNPNKVYALIGAFGRNPTVFHQKNGEGYLFLADVVRELDQLNPQIAARMVNPLTQWRRYDAARQALMRERLEALLHTSLSSDVFELVSKSLEEK